MATTQVEVGAKGWKVFCCCCCTVSLPARWPECGFGAWACHCVCMRHRSLRDRLISRLCGGSAAPALLPGPLLLPPSVSAAGATALRGTPLPPPCPPGGRSTGTARRTCRHQGGTHAWAVGRVARSAARHRGVHARRPAACCGAGSDSRALRARAPAACRCRPASTGSGSWPRWPGRWPTPRPAAPPGCPRPPAPRARWPAPAAGRGARQVGGVGAVWGGAAGRRCQDPGTSKQAVRVRRPRVPASQHSVNEDMRVPDGRGPRCAHLCRRGLQLRLAGNGEEHLLQRGQADLHVAHPQLQGRQGREGTTNGVEGCGDEPEAKLQRPVGSTAHTCCLTLAA